MASSSKPPTARKASTTIVKQAKRHIDVAQKPVLVSLSLKGAAKTKARKNDTSEGRGGRNQGRWKMSASQSPAMAGNKRKADLKKQSCSSEANSKGMVAAASHPGTGLPAKKQKTETEEPSAETSSSPPSFQASNPSAALGHSSTPTASSHALQNSTTLLTHVLEHNPHVLPTCPSTDPIASSHVDAIAHIMWQVAFAHGQLLQRACQYGSLFSPLKLAALAKLNLLPSWWFFRDLAVRSLRRRARAEGWVVDDGHMEGVWGDAVRWCIMVRGESARESAEGITGEDEETGDAMMGA